MSTHHKHSFKIKQKGDGAQPTNTTGNVTTGQPLFIPISGKVAKNLQNSNKANMSTKVLRRTYLWASTDLKESCI
jgi:hypothetical protein